MRWPPPMISPYPSGAMKSTPSATWAIVGRLEVKRLHDRGIAVHHHGTIQIFGEQRLIGVTEIAAPHDNAVITSNKETP
jgi:hypothetical protein